MTLWPPLLQQRTQFLSQAVSQQQQMQGHGSPLLLTLLPLSTTAITFLYV